MPIITGQDVEYRTKWEPKKGVQILTMGKIPRELHGPGCQPRTIYGDKAWNATRKQCYADAGYICEACGQDGSEKRGLHAHELFKIDYAKGTSEFIGCVALDPECHLYIIHTGRALTLYKRGNPIYSAERLLRGAEKCFRLLDGWNSTHRSSKPLRAYGTFLEYLKQDELSPDMEKLIKKYDIKFWLEDPKKRAPWDKWKLILDGEEYPSPYSNEKEWKEKMQELDKSDPGRHIEDPFSDQVFQDLAQLLKEKK